MRFLIEYKNFNTKATKNRSLELLDTFLNEYLIGKYHGNRFNCLIIRFIANPPTSRKLQLKTLYKTYAIVEVGITIVNDEKVNLMDFEAGLMTIEDAIRKASSIEISEEKLEYHEEELVNDYRNSRGKAPKTIEELKRYAKDEKETKFENRVKRVDCYIQTRSLNPLPLNKRLSEIIVSERSNKRILFSFAYQFTEVLSNLLRHADMKLPGYERIVVNIAATVEEAKQDIPLEDWYTLTYSDLNFNEFVSATDEQKFHLLLESIRKGLCLIAEFDHLDKDKFEGVIDKVMHKGLDMELIFGSKQNEKYLAELLYIVPNSPAEKADFNLRLTDFASGKTGVVPVASVGTWRAPHCFGNISIKKKEIVITGRKSFQADLSRKMEKVPEKFTFEISEILLQA